MLLAFGPRSIIRENLKNRIKDGLAKQLPLHKPIRHSSGRRSADRFVDNIWLLMWWPLVWLVLKERDGESR